jgi:tetratricopeptide (TPR) repeat protein
VLRRGVAWLFLLLVPIGAAAASAPEILPAPSEFERWVEVKAEEFVIFSNAGKGKTEEIAGHLLRFRAALAKASRLPVRSPLPISVYAFKSTSSFAPYRDLVLGRRAKGVAGIFVRAADGPLILFDASGRWSAEHVIYHELTHSFMGNEGRPLPLWLTEGVADFYAAFDVEAGSVRIGLPTGQIALLREREWLPLGEVLSADGTSPLYTDPKKASLFYAESWAMVHYLYADCPARRGQLAAYLRLLDFGRPVEQAFAAAFGTGFDGFEKELKAYVDGPEMQYLRLRGDQLGRISLATPTAVPHDELLARLGYLLLRGSQAAFPSAEAFLGQAFAFNPHNITALTGLAVARGKEGRPEEAWKLYERALEFQPDDVRPYLDAAGVVVERLEKGSDRPRADADLARGLLRRALELGPNDARGWAELGRTYVLVPDRDGAAGIDALERCLALDPEEFAAARDLVVLYVRAGRLERATEVNGRFLTSCRDAEVVRSAHEALLAGSLDRIERAVAAGELDDALAMADQAVRTAHDWLAGDALAKRAVEVRAGVQGARQRKAYDDALAQAARGDLAAAIATLDTLAPPIADPALAEAVELERAKLRRQIAAGQEQARPR